MIPDFAVGPAARHVGRVGVLLAVRLPLDRRTGAKSKILMPRIADRPPACLWRERVDLCSGGRFDGARSLRPKFAAAVRPGSDGDLFDLIDLYYSHDHETEDDADPDWGAADSISPTSETPRSDVEYLGKAMLWKAECVECFLKFRGVHRYRSGIGIASRLSTASLRNP
jgi:hypothetical protein